MAAPVGLFVCATGFLGFRVLLERNGSVARATRANRLSIQAGFVVYFAVCKGQTDKKECCSRRFLVFGVDCKEHCIENCNASILEVWLF